MRTKSIVVGDSSAASELARSFAEGMEPLVWSPDTPCASPEPGSSEPLARALAAFEAEAEARPPDEVLLADDSEAALAALLVATKLLIGARAVEAARRSTTANGRLIALLAGAYTAAR